MQQCRLDPFCNLIKYEQPTPSAAKKYFQISDALPIECRKIYDILLNAIPQYINSHTSQKVSLIRTKEELASHLNQFKKALRGGKNGKFSCFIFDRSCTFLGEMHYGVPKNSKKYHEICFYSGQIDISKEQAKEGSFFEGNFRESRLISEASTDLDDAESQVSTDDELAISAEQESPNPDWDLYDGPNNFYERSITVQDADGYNFIISTLPSLNQMKRIFLSEEEIKPQFYAQVCGVSKNTDAAIQILFQTIRDGLVSGYFDE